MKPIHRDILRAILSATIAVESEPEPPRWRAPEHREWRERQAYGPNWKPREFFDCGGDDALRMRFSRGVKELIRSGLLVGHKVCGTHMSHVKLTAAGRAAAESLATEAAP